MEAVVRLARQIAVVQPPHCALCKPRPTEFIVQAMLKFCWQQKPGQRTKDVETMTAYNSSNVIDNLKAEARLFCKVGCVSARHCRTRRFIYVGQHPYTPFPVRYHVVSTLLASMLRPPALQLKRNIFLYLLYPQKLIEYTQVDNRFPRE